MSAFELVAVYDAIRRIRLLGIDSKVTHRIVGTKSIVFDESGLLVQPDGVYEDLRVTDLLVIPGGLAARQLMHDEPLLDYLRRNARGKYVATVSTGALIAGEAGLLKGKRA